MTRMLLVLTLSGMAAGCLSRQIRQEAALTLACHDVRLEWNEAHQSWVAQGCNRMAICTRPEVDGADVQCVGGGEVVAGGERGAEAASPALTLAE